jgi:hypothetical protein
VPFLVWLGWVTSKLWQWFAEEPFGLPHITVAQAIGIQMIVTVFTMHIVRNSTLWDENDEYTWTSKFSKQAVINLLGPGFLILLGWGVRQFL